MTEGLKGLKKYTGLIKALILIGTLVFMAIKIYQQGGEVDVRSLGKILQTGENKYLLILSLLLVPINLGLEAIKWQVIVEKIEKISFQQSLVGVLSGLTMGFITPHAVGDYAGRIWQLKSSKRIHTIGGLLVGRLMQFAVTLLFGVIGIVLAPQQEFSWIPLLFIYGWALLLVLFFMLYPGFFLKVLNFGPLKKLRIYFRIIENYSAQAILKIFVLSALRYGVFTSQFVLILVFFQVHDSLVYLFAGASFIFLIKSSVPTYNFLSDLGVRETSALFFFSMIGGNATNVIGASLLLWGINILLPALLGMFFVYSMRMFDFRR